MSSPRVETARIHDTWDVWACRADLSVADAQSLSAARVIADALLEDVTAAASKFEPDSELSQLNRAEGNWHPVSDLLLDMVTIALRAAAQSEGLVDPTIGHLISPLTVSSSISTGLTRVVRSDWRSVEVDPVLGRVRLPLGVQLDLGATGKAYAADLIAESIHFALGTAALVGLGGDIAAAGDSPDTLGWPVVVLERADDLTGEAINVVDGGVATSSTCARSQPGMELAHIVDPRTARPAVHHWRTVTVAAATCVEANTATTAAIIRGEGAITWLRDLGLPARLVDRRGNVVRLNGWPM